MTNHLRPVDIPEDVIEKVATLGRMDTAEATDFIVYMFGRMRPLVVDLELERFFDWMKRLPQRLPGAREGRAGTQGKSGRNFRF
jgi:hypothetical protein